MLNIGSVVGIQTEFILQDIHEILQTLNYSLRPEIYGVVKEINNDEEYLIHWATGGLLNIGDEMKSRLDEKIYNENDLVLISKEINEETDDNMYLNNFFAYDNNIGEWAIYDWTLICQHCHDIPSGYWGCQRKNSKVQMCMAQLYLDLTATYNEGLTGVMKVDMCRKMYEAVNPFTDITRIDSCVDLEIRTLFRDVDGTMFDSPVREKKKIKYDLE